MTDTLSPDEQERFDALYGTTPTAAAPASAGFIAGAYKGLAGVPSGLSGAALSTASFLSDTDAQLGEDYGDFIGLPEGMAEPWNVSHQAIERTRQDVADFYRPDPQTTGFVGNTLFGAADVITRIGAGNLLAPGSGLALAAGTTGYERTSDLEAQGVDRGTATLSGVLTGGSLVVMGGGASFGRTTLERVLAGGATNVAIGATTRGLDSTLLDANGYHAQAEQQRWNDGATMLADLIIGSAFGALPHAKAQARPDAAMVDAALTAKSAQNVADLAPGVPADPKAARAHVDALDTALTQLMDGEPVTAEATGATFVPRTTDDPASAAARVLDAVAERGKTDDTAPAIVAGLRIAPKDDGFHVSDMRDVATLPDDALFATRDGETLSRADAEKLVRSAIALRDRPGTALHDALVESGIPVEDLAAAPEAAPEGLSPAVREAIDTDVVLAADKARAERAATLDAPAFMAAERTERAAKHEAATQAVAEAKAAREQLDADMAAFREGHARWITKKGGLRKDTPGDVVAIADEIGARAKQVRHAEGVAGFDRQQSLPLSEAALRDMYDRLRERMPVDRSPTPAQDVQPTPEPAARAANAPPDQATARTDAGAQPSQPRTAGADAGVESRTGLDPARDREVERARVVAAERPDTPLDNGADVADALRAADEAVTQAQSQGDGIRAAIACFLRFGASAS